MHLPSKSEILLRTTINKWYHNSQLNNAEHSCFYFYLAGFLYEACKSVFVMTSLFLRLTLMQNWERLNKITLWA